MNGHVDGGGRALLDLELRAASNLPPLTITAWIDTGFTGDLVLPLSLIEDLALPQSGTVAAILADGSQIAMSTYACLIHWFGSQQPLQVVANAGEYPLLDVGLLLGRELRIDYRANSVTLR